MAERTMRILVASGHLGTAPFGLESFYRGMETNPDAVTADSGSNDPGPVYLGANIPLGLFEEDDLEQMLVASRKHGIPMIIGSAGDSGTNRRVDFYVNTIKKLAEKHRIPKFRLGYFYSEVSKEYLKRKIKVIEGLEGFPLLTTDDIDNTSRIVGMAGVHPFIQLMDMGADVIIGGRCCDIAFIAALPIKNAFPEGLVYHMAKMTECASLCAEPYMSKETVIGTVSDCDIKITPFHPNQRCTVASAYSHSMYERESPFYEYAVGGMLDMSECKYEQFDERTCRITGAKWVPSKEVRVKIEGAKKVGERYIGIAAYRDPYIIQQIDKVIQRCRDSVEKKFGKTGYQLHFHIFGKNGVLKDLEPVKEIRSHELCIVAEGVAPTEELAEKITTLSTQMMFLARIPGAKATGGTAAVIEKKPMRATPAYQWSINHTVAVDDPMELFEVHLTEAGM